MLYKIINIYLKLLDYFICNYIIYIKKKSNTCFISKTNFFSNIVKLTKQLVSKGFAQLIFITLIKEQRQ